jgi:ABC-type glycerol-3-phosphate transport system substrate-binding protein
MNNFQTILVAIFLAFFVFAVLIFSGLIKIDNKSGSGSDLQGKVLIWGTLTSSDFKNVFEEANDSKNNSLSVNYIKKSSDTYEQDLIEAFAKGNAPDIFIISEDMIGKFENFSYVIPFENYPERTFRDSFIDGAEIFLSKKGLIALPILVDPVVMFYNKTLFTNEGLATVPKYWDELFDLSSKLTKKTGDGVISQSMIALGRYDNIEHSKEILSTLFLQNGSKILERVEDDKDRVKYSPSLSEKSESSMNPVVNVLNFFLEFSNPTLSAYSWNRSLSSSFDMFTSGREAMYIGMASDLFKIQETNPNLSFDVTEVLQTKGLKAKTTYGKFYAFMINKNSKNLATSYAFAMKLSSKENAGNFSKALSLPPVLRSLLASKPSDSYLTTFYNSAIFSKSWIDYDPKKSDIIFEEMIQNILSNKLNVDSAVGKAEDQLEKVLK